jgi:hypothetical protein
LRAFERQLTIELGNMLMVAFRLIMAALGFVRATPP